MKDINVIHKIIFINHIKDINSTKQYTGRPAITQYFEIYKSIIFKVSTGVSWIDTKIYGKYSTSTVFNYFSTWNKIGLFEKIYKSLLNVYSKTRRFNWKNISIDSTTIKCYRGGDNIGSNSTLSKAEKKR